MNLEIKSNAANLGVAIHAVVGCAETHSLFKPNMTHSLYECLSDALGGAVIPRLIYVVDRVANEGGLKTFDKIETEGVDNDFDINAKGYTDVQSFHEFAEILYLINTANQFSQKMSKLPQDADKAVIQSLVDACVKQSADDIIRGSRVLNVDSRAFEKVASIQCEENPLPYLSPIFNMLYDLGEGFTLAAIRKDFGERELEKWASFISECHQKMLITVPNYKQATVYYDYVF